MKKPLFFAIGMAMVFSECTKKSNVTPVQKIVYINGSDYPMVIIGSQSWTAANYNGDGGFIDDVPTNGKLYTIAEANAIPLPAGWRLPTMDDINSLLSAEGASEPAKGSNTSVAATGAPVLSLMSTTGWTNGNGNNSSGFNALPIGYYSESVFKGDGTDALFITSATYNGKPLSFDVNQTNTGNLAYLTNFVLLSSDRASIRFVKDN